MKKLLLQVMKFGLAGIAATIIDFAVFHFLSMCSVYYIVSNICSYFCSMLANYWMSVNFVFHHREGWSRKKEFVMFLFLSLIGLFINTFFLWFFYDILYVHIVRQNIQNTGNIGKLLCKIGATIVLLIYNFISKKLFLEKTINF